MKTIITIITLFFSIYLPGCAQSLNEYKKYLQDNILHLDPLEGIYDAEFYTQEYLPNYSWPKNKSSNNNIMIVKDKNGFFHLADNDQMVFQKIGDSNVYSITITFGSSPIYSRGYLENGINLRYEYDIPRSSNRRGDNHYYRVGGNLIKVFPTAKMYNDALEKEVQKNAASSGTGFLLSNSGYIITNNHVIENAQNGNIRVSGINDDNQRSYKAKVEIADKQNDLAILKITDSSFSSNINIPYTFKFNTSSVGEECFVLGYPLISSMGRDIKLTTGIISSKTGYDGNIAQYQISAPVQPGNSGGPLFDKDGNIIGIVQAKHTQAENAGYAIKASYIRNLVELLPATVAFPDTNLLKGETLPQQVELASKYVCLIIVNGD